ncbi:MAG: hypothetical protein WC587_00755 [Candidatus Paceibacterota bacterium]
MADASTIENNHAGRLGQLRKEAQLAKDVAKAAAGGSAAKAKLALSFGKKVSEHWLILVAAVLFDIVGLIPGLCIVVNFLFGLILFLYFGPKSKGGSEFTKIFLPIAGGSVIDFFIGVLPVNIGAALFRIALS